MKIRHLLAKSTKDQENPRREETLVGHTEAVIEAASAFNEILASSITALFDHEYSQQMWEDALFCAAWLHDLGKANDHFQRMLRDSNFYQGIRHETLGFVVLNHLLSDTLDQIASDKNYPHWFRAAVFFSVSGHHLKFPDQKERGGLKVDFIGSHSQMKKLLEIGKQRFSLETMPETVDMRYSLGLFSGIDEKVDETARELYVDFSKREKLFIAVLKSFLMCADIAGSALPEKIGNKGQRQNIREWLIKRILPVLTEQQLKVVVQKKLEGCAPKKFQETAENTEKRTSLIEAGCGSGKTAAAYLWASKQAVGKRLFFCYPTTATAAEGFAGYLPDPDFEAILVNSRAEVDYRLLPNMPERPGSQREFRDMQLEALETWPIPVVVCTVHTVLGLLQNVRRGIVSVPSMIRSAFVFDEVHAYDSKLFRHFLRFLEVFKNVPVLMMTATLPPSRKKALDKVCEERGGIFYIQGPEDRENAKRYFLQRSDKEYAWIKAQEVLISGGKVLWVCNTVPRVLNIIEEARKKKLPLQPFHSRYRYKDRLKRQRKVVDGFEPNEPAMLAITTQVAEMSLDLSADLLISEYAPIASMIQRLGRLNRFEDIPSICKMALFIKPENALPYVERKCDEGLFWDKIESWFDIVADNESKSQKELADAFIEIEEKETIIEDRVVCDWIDDPRISLTNRKSIMDPGYTLNVVRQEDLKKGPADEIVIPMPFPKRNIWETWMKIKRGKYRIAPTGTIEYDPTDGGKYAKEEPKDFII